MKKILFVLFATLALVACKKDAQIEKNLWKNGGSWNIDVFDQKETSTYFASDNAENYIQNAGTIQFNEDGTGVFNFQGVVSPMTYKNSEKTLTITFKDISGNPQDDEVWTFNMEWEKNKMNLSSYIKDTYTTHDGASGTVVVTYTNSQKMKLSKI